MVSRMMLLFTLVTLVGAFAGVGIHPASAQVAEAASADDEAAAQADDRGARHADAGLFPIHVAPAPEVRFPTVTQPPLPDTDPVPAALQQEERRFPQGVALVAAGTALIITGSLVNDAVGRAIVVGGAGLVGWGVYRLLR